MDCTQCAPKHCRSTDSCGAEKFETDQIVSDYKESINQIVVQNSAVLVDGGRSGTLSRLDEIIEFVKSMKYEKIGLAYCYGMESDAKLLKEIFRKEGLKLITVSCTVGGISQESINSSSCNMNVSCNPIGQAKQLEAENVQFVILMGICLGHDILLHRNLKIDFTTFIVKDRVFNHQPHLALR